MQPIRPKVCNSLQSSLNTQEITGGFSQNQQSWQVIGCMKPPITPVIKAAPVLVFVLGKVTTSAAEMGLDSRGEVRFSSFHRQSVPTRLSPQTLRRKFVIIITNTTPDDTQNRPGNDPTSSEPEKPRGNSLWHKAGDQNDADQLNTAARGAFCSPRSLHIIFIHWMSVHAKSFSKFK